VIGVRRRGALMPRGWPGEPEWAACGCRPIPAFLWPGAAADRPASAIRLTGLCTRPKTHDRRSPRPSPLCPTPPSMVRTTRPSVPPAAVAPPSTCVTTVRLRAQCALVPEGPISTRHDAGTGGRLGEVHRQALRFSPPTVTRCSRHATREATSVPSAKAELLAIPTLGPDARAIRLSAGRFLAGGDTRFRPGPRSTRCERLRPGQPFHRPSHSRCKMDATPVLPLARPEGRRVAQSHSGRRRHEQTRLTLGRARSARLEGWAKGHVPWATLRDAVLRTALRG